MLSGKVQPKYKDILDISNVLQVSPSFFFETNDNFYPSEIGYIISSRVYSVLYSNQSQKTLILRGRALESDSFIPRESKAFLLPSKDKAIYSLTLISGEIRIGGSSLVEGLPMEIVETEEVSFTVGAIFIVQIIGDVSSFIELIKNYLRSEAIIKF